MGYEIDHVIEDVQKTNALLYLVKNNFIDISETSGSLILKLQDTVTNVSEKS